MIGTKLVHLIVSKSQTVAVVACIRKELTTLLTEPHVRVYYPQVYHLIQVQEFVPQIRIKT